MMVLSSQTSHFSHSNGISDTNHPTRSRTLNGSGIYSGDSRMPRSSHSITSTQSPSPPIMYVRALYNYAADDPTSLSFNQGDLIQVLTQLESGWWDGIVNGQRGWFPSNYCAVVQNSELTAEQQNNHLAALAVDDDDDDDEDDFDDDFDNDDEDSDKDLRDRKASHIASDGPDAKEHDEAAFWLPQVTADGRLYYFNTMTGASKMELPLETPSSNSESGPRDRSTYTAPENTRPPLELMTSVYEQDDSGFNHYPEDPDGDTASEKDGEMIHLGMPSPVRGDYQQSIKSNRSSGHSLASNKKAETNGHVNGDRDDAGYNHDDADGSRSFTTDVDDFSSDTLAFYEDTLPVPTTWDTLIEETQLAVDRYKQALAKRDRKQYVSRAEDISDMLRLLIAAGSATTDNHSGQPTIISTNKSLHPHFRHFMAAFSKLVLSSHVASTDWPPADAEAKCLAEAEEVKAGVIQFGEVARAQKEDIVPRLTPGFIVGSHTGGSWSLGGKHSKFYGNRDSTNSTSTQLDSQLVERLEALKGVVIPSLRQLDNALETPGPISTAHQQGVVGAFVISAAQNAVDSLRAYFQFLDSINLAPLTQGPKSPTFIDFAITKQRLFDSFADLFMACQTVTAPLADEWSSAQGLPLEDRLNDVRIHIKGMEQGVQSLVFTAQLLVEERESRMPKQKDDFRKMSESQIRETMTRQGQFENGRVKGRPRAGSSSAERSLTDSTHDMSASSNAKIKKFFGAEPTMPRREAEETPWFLGTDTDEANGIQYDSKNAVRGATLEVLVERLTRHDFLDSNFNNTFLLTYRSFTTANQLFTLLTDRFNIQPPPGLSQSEHEVWMERKQKPIRLRVLNILKSWFETFWMEPKGEAEIELLQRVNEFAKVIMAPAFPGTSALINLIEQRLQGRDPAIKKLLLNLSTTPPPPIYPKNMKKLKFLDIDPLEFARQLTIIESRAYTKIKPTECLSKAWSKPADQAPDPAENVKAMILHSNQLTNWVAEMILCQPEVRKRVVVIKHFISVAEKCRALNNFSTLTAIISALSASPIHRLKRTWDQVPTRTYSALESMRCLMGTTRNFGEYRECLHIVNPPCVPFLGVYLTDLTFIEDGNPDFIKKTDLINFAKRAKTAEVIREIQQFQLTPYPLQPVEELQQYILSNMQAAKDVHEMYNVSLQIEPREREDEKIARLLQESGFL